MIYELLYWASQIGLALVAVFGLAIIILRGHASGRRYYYALWATSSLSAITLCLPAIQTVVMPWPVHILFLAMGGAFTEGYFTVRKNATYVVSPEQVHRANRVLLIGTGVAVIVLIIVGVIRHINAADEADKRKDEIVKTSQQIVKRAQQITSQKITADTAAAKVLKTSLDSTNKLLRQAEKERAIAARAAAKEREALARRTRTIEKNTDTLKNKLDEIAPDPVPAKPAKKGLFRRIFGATDGADLDSLRTISHQ